MTGPGSSPSIICESERLILRPVTIEDAEPTFQTNADPEVARFIGGVKTLDWHIQRTQEIIDHQRLHGLGRWSVVLKSSGELIGRCGLMFKKIESVPEVELGYTFAREFWGRGYATEAAKATLDHALQRLGQRRIVAIIDPRNHASLRVARKIGMSYERMIEWEGEPATLYVAQSATVPVQD